jgi:hypothetical protein
LGDPLNRYLPPRAPVDDPAFPRRERPPMPGLVRWGIGLLYCQFAIGTVRLMLSLSDFVGLPGPAPAWRVFSVVGGGATIALVGLLIWMMAQGRNWARISYLVLLSVGLLLSMMTFGVGVPGVSTAPNVGGLVEMLLQVVGLGLLFAPRSNDWFRSPAD